MEHAVIFVCIKMQLQTVLCFTYNMFFIRIFEIKRKLHTTSGSITPPPQENSWVRTWLCLYTAANRFENFNNYPELFR
jgi:hypothetical protein